MIRKLGQAVRRSFDTGMAARLPQFVSHKPNGSLSGLRFYRCAVNSDLFFYVILSVSDKNDEFTVEIAWAEVDEWGPHYMVIRSDDPLDNGIVHFRLTSLLEDIRTDLWWAFVRARSGDTAAKLLTSGLAVFNVDFDATEDDRTAFLESALGLIQPAVDDAVERTCKYAIPYFGEVAKARGCADQWQHAMRGQP